MPSKFAAGTVADSVSCGDRYHMMIRHHSNVVAGTGTSGDIRLEGESEPILERIAAGDHSAVAQCMDRYGGLVWTLARRWSDNAADAEDATQEIFLEVWKSAERYQPSLGSEAVFITTIARRRMIDKLRHKQRRPQTQSLSDDEWSQEFADPAGDQGMIGAEADIARRALATLKPDQQQILLMGVVEGMTHSEIAAATGKPLGTVKTQLRRGLIRVRELIEQNGREGAEGGSA